MGYHKAEIPSGVLGEFSKIEEEFLELKDANEQNNTVLQICELCDLLGAIELYANKWNINMDDLIQMKDATKEAFISGDRN